MTMRLLFLMGSLLVSMLLPTHVLAAWNTAGAVVRGDFNNDGVLEIVASSPEADSDKGAVDVIDLASGTATRWTRDTSGLAGAGAVAGDYFGAALAVGNFDGDAYDDLAIGAPGADDSGETDSGAVHIIYGSSTGLTTSGDQVFHQDTTGIDGVAEDYDGVGDVLTTGDFDCDGYADVVFGVPNEGVGSNAGAGAIQVLYGSGSGVSTVDDIYHQGASGVDGVAEAGDHFGGAVAAGNFNGDDDSGTPCQDLAVASPDEDVGSITDAGYVYTILGGTSGLSSTGDLAWHQDSSGVEDTAEDTDRFGARLRTLDYDGDGYDELEVVVPGDSCMTGYGEAVQRFFGTSTGITLTGDIISCWEYGCQIDGTEAEYRCFGDPKIAHGTSAAETFYMQFGDDVVFAGGRNDEVWGAAGDDVLFGGDNNDALDGGGGVDVLLGGSGNDSFTVDLDCEAQPGEVIDGGDGYDTVYSHLSQSQLSAAGVTILGIESFVAISPDPDVHGFGCDPYPVINGVATEPIVDLAWSEVPDPDDETTTSTGLLHLQVVNTASVDVTVEVGFVLTARGMHSIQSATALNLEESGVSGDRDSIELDLNDFIPGGVDPENVDPDLLELPTSAKLVAVALVSVGSVLVESPTAMPLYGHLDLTEEEAVIYGPEALRTVYNGGDLAHLSQPPQERTALAGVSEVYGSHGIPAEIEDP